MNNYPAIDMVSLLLDTREPNARPSVVTGDSQDCRWDFTRLGNVRLGYRLECLTGKSICNISVMVPFSSLITLAHALKFTLDASTRRRSPLMSPARTMGRKVRTLQLEQHALTHDLCTCLAHPPERQQDLLLVAAHAVREDVHVIAVLEKVQSRLQHTDIRLRRQSGIRITLTRRRTDAPRCP
jgi:hypothetical protein